MLLMLKQCAQFSGYQSGSCDTQPSTMYLRVLYDTAILNYLLDLFLYLILVVLELHKQTFFLRMIHF